MYSKCVNQQFIVFGEFGILRLIINLSVVKCSTWLAYKVLEEIPSRVVIAKKEKDFRKMKIIIKDLCTW